MPNYKENLKCPSCNKDTLPHGLPHYNVVACQSMECQAIVDLTHSTIIGRWKDGKEIYKAPEGKTLLLSNERGIEVVDKPEKSSDSHGEMIWESAKYDNSYDKMGSATLDCDLGDRKNLLCPRCNTNNLPYTHSGLVGCLNASCHAIVDASTKKIIGGYIDGKAAFFKESK